MTLFTRIATTALAATCLLGQVGAAQAHHIKQQPFVKAETMQLLRSARAAGIQIFTEGDPSTRGQCRDGLYGMANNSRQLLICVSNHGDDVDELADTIRHELIHSAQFCKGNGRNALLYPEQADTFLDLARNQLHMPMDRYKPAKHAAEAEARVLAHVMEEHEVAAELSRYCS